MRAYYDGYLNDVVENQGKLFDYVSYKYSGYDTKDFITFYMKSMTRDAIDKSQAYVNTMDYDELLSFFLKNDNYVFKKGKTIEGFIPYWIGEFYAYYQWYFNIPSSKVVDKITVDFLIIAYPSLHDLDLEEAVKKVGEIK